MFVVTKYLQARDSIVIDIIKNKANQKKCNKSYDMQNSNYNLWLYYE